MTAGRWRHGSGWLPGDLGEAVAALGDRLGVDAVGLLLERAGLMGLQPPTDVSAGGATRLLRTADEWIAVSLARSDDWDLVPAWLGSKVVGEGEWGRIATAVDKRSSLELVTTAILLGLPVARVGERIAPPLGPVGRVFDASGVRVVDLSTLWAGPLIGRLLVDAGADVVKVESADRPDGSRRGNAEFHERLNGPKRSVVLDFVAERDELHRLVTDADVVITSARARALDQLGLLPPLVEMENIRVAVTGHGVITASVDRVAFGDDAAVAGGLVAWEDDAPRFVGDAIADPLTGLVGAARVFDALAAGRTGLIDLAMADVAASFAPVGGA